MSEDRKLPVVIYGIAPVPDHQWYKGKKVSTNTEYSGDECRADRKAELRKRALYLEEPFPRDREYLDGVTRMKQEKARTFEPAPFLLPKGATAIYCIKTGQLVGQMLTSYEYPPHATHPDWKVTDGKNLDTMQDKDARAYVAFCLGLIDTFWRQRQHRGSNLTKSYMTKIDALEHHWSLVKAYDTLGQVSDIHLRELANALCRFCTYAPLSYRVLDDKLLAHQRQADQLANAAVNGVLLTSLERATVRTLATAEQFQTAIKTPKFEERPSSIEDAAKGPSNIRAQSKSRDYVKNAKQNKLMADILREFGGVLGWANIAPKRPNQAQSLLGRVSRGAQIDHNVTRATYGDDTENDMLDELNRLMGGSSFVSSDDEYDDDNTVEVRTIPRALVETLVEPKTAPATVQETPKPQVSASQSLLARLRRN